MHHPESLFELVNDGVMIRSLEGKIYSWNHSATKLYGWTKEEAIGKISHELLQTQFPQPLEEIESVLVRNGQWEGQLRHSTRDGGRLVIASRWALDTGDRSQSVVEVNARATVCQIEPKGSTKTDVLLTKIANIVIAGCGSVSLLVVFYFLYHYAWMKHREFSSWLGPVIYYLVPAVLAALMLACLKLRPRYKINWALVLLSLTASVYGGEIFLQFVTTDYGPKKPTMSVVLDSDDKLKLAAQLKKKFAVDIDTRSSSQVMADLRKQGVDAVPVITPSNNLFIEQPDGSINSAISVEGEEVMPLSGISNKVTVLCNESGQWVTYPSDEHGFNNPKAMWRPGQIEIAALGDSFTQGYCVPPGKSFVDLIRQRYPATLNLGVAGDGPLLMLATLSEYLAPLKPKQVLWFYFEGNDPTDLQSERKSALISHYLKGGFSQRLLARQRDLDIGLTKDLARQNALGETREIRRRMAKEGAVDKLLEFAKLARLRQRLNLVDGQSDQAAQAISDLNGVNLGVLGETLSLAKSRINDWGGKVYFIYLPTWSRYFGTPEPVVAVRQQTLTLVRSLGVPVIDIDPVFRAQPDLRALFPFREPAHYNEQGHRLVAEQVLNAISR